MGSEPQTLRYGFWTGLFDIEALFERPPTPAYPSRHGNHYYWQEARAAEGGRMVLVSRDPGGREQCLTPEDFSLRSRVHEYGGCSYTIAGDACYFVNDGDQRIYRQRLKPGAAPVPVTPADEGGTRRRYIDLQVTMEESHLFCVMEIARDGEEIENVLAAVRLEAGALHPPRVLHRGHDFYANPVLDEGRRRIAWFHWDHPYMPWDRSEAMIASWSVQAGEIALTGTQQVIGRDDTSVCQLAFDDNGDLLLAIDGDGAPGATGNYWNLFRWRDGRFTQLTFDQREYGAPHWVFGDRRYVPLKDCILAVRTGPDGDELVTVDRQGGGAEAIATDVIDIRQLSRAGPNEAVMIAASRDRSPTPALWNHGLPAPIKDVHELLPPDAVSRPRAVAFPTGDGDTAHAYFYPPCNLRFRGPQDEAPPLLVMVHGGPTARCVNALDLTRQYWTGMGFAVLDVNYRGSSGYGRAYRQSLLGGWGRDDVEDVVQAIGFVAGKGWVDPGRVFIRGRSAGGYAVLSALTGHPEVFAAGACYYGIGNLSTLARITHKFEGRYTDRLVGEDYDPDRDQDPGSRYYTRSPIHYVAHIRSPVIVFQGLEDRVVPPDVSREIAAALDRQGLDFDYVEYPGEGHGFRGRDTNVDALKRETAFFRRVLDAGMNEAARPGASGRRSRP